MAERILEFDYTMTPLEFKIRRNPPSLVTGKAFRPLLSLELRNGPLSIQCFGLTDSGADSCIFPSRFMEQLGIKSWRTAPSTTALGIAQLQAQVASVTINLIDERCVAPFEAEVGFVSDLDEWSFNGQGIGLLGQQGFFDKFKITFDGPRAKFYIEESY